MKKKIFSIKLKNKEALELYEIIDEAIWALILGHHNLDKSSNDYKDKLKTLETMENKFMIPYLQRDKL
tara:strand:+ start:65 stop:268 length:204 start_codon:yes stop_codon:yes gene_type:complete